MITGTHISNLRIFRTLLDIELYEVTGDEIGELRGKANHDRFFEKEILPEFCVHIENGNIARSNEYLYWIDSGEEKYLLFNAQTSDKLLGEEISQCGLPELLKGFDFNYILQTFTKHKLKDQFHQIPPSEYLIVELQYRGRGEDTELDVDVIGKLNLDNIE